MSTSGGMNARHSRSRRTRCGRVVAALGLSLASALAPAAQQPPPGAVNCAVDAGGGLAFGNYDVFSQANDTSQGTVTVSCTRRGRRPPPLTVNFTVSLSPGNAGSYSPRAMAGPAGMLGYNIYADPNYATIWGDGSPGTQTVPGAVAFGRGQTSAATSLTIYGSVPARQNVTAAAYSDSIVATLNY